MDWINTWVSMYGLEECLTKLKICEQNIQVRIFGTRSVLQVHNNKVTIVIGIGYGTR